VGWLRALRGFGIQLWPLRAGSLEEDERSSFALGDEVSFCLDTLAALRCPD
jgi:hypothetical protein